MTTYLRTLLLAVLLGAMALGCAGPATTGARTPDRVAAAPPATGADPEPAPPRATKRVVTAIAIEPDLGPSRPISGAPAFRVLLRGGLTIPDAHGVRQPQLAEVVPTVDNGLWKVLPDGRMETTWKIRPGATWHDGQPFTADDLLFTATVLRDRGVPDFRTEAYDWIDSADALDPRTVRVTWTRTFIGADTLFSHELTPAFPKHLLEPTYLDDRASFTRASYWRDDFVGTGPFKLREWVAGSHAVLDAHEDYVLGRPKLDVIEVRFIPDGNTRVANVLAGSVEVTLGAGLSIEQAIQAGAQWSEGRAVVELTGNWVVMFPQFINPTLAAVTDRRLRQALLHALDREEMAETLQLGQVPVAHSYIAPNQPQYREHEGRVVRYERDARRTAQLLDEMGYARGADGMYRDRAGQPLAVPLRSAPGDLNHRTMLAVASYWERVGLTVTQEALPPARADDLEYVATFPGFMITSTAHDVRGVADLHSSRTRLPENNFRVPGLANQSRYRNAELDALIDRYFTTIPTAARAQAMGDIAVYVAEHLNVMGLMYGGSPELISHRVRNVASNRALTNPWNTWNAHEWDVRP